MIGGDKAKTQTYCQIMDLGRQINQAVREKDQKKAKAGGVVFFTYLEKERTDLLDFHAVGGDKWATLHGWLYYTGRVMD